MSTRTYIVHLFGAPQHMPQAICGRSKKTYGHAIYSRKDNAHVFKIPASVWEPDPKRHGDKGGGWDILGNTKRRATVNVLCVSTIDPADADVALAEENARLLARNAELEAIVPRLDEALNVADGLLVALGVNPEPDKADAGTLQQPADTMPMAQLVAAKRDLEAAAVPSGSLEALLNAYDFRTLRGVARKLKSDGITSANISKIKNPEDMVAFLKDIPGIADHLPPLEKAA